jgi:hypothetical protein
MCCTVRLQAENAVSRALAGKRHAVTADVALQQ